MEKVIPRLHPKGVLIMFAANDLVLAFSEERSLRGSPFDDALERRVAQKGWKSFLLSHSRLYQAKFDARLRHRADSLALPQSPHRDWSPKAMRSVDTLPQPAVLLAGLPEFRKHILRMQTLARATGTRAVFLTQPLLYGSGPRWDSVEAREVEFDGRTYRLSAGQERRLLDAFNGALLSECAESRLECVDLASALSDSQAYFYDPAHLTEAGAARVAEFLAARLPAP
jgi:hypothetical protein